MELIPFDLLPCIPTIWQRMLNPRSTGETKMLPSFSIWTKIKLFLINNFNVPLVLFFFFLHYLLSWAEAVRQSFAGLLGAFWAHAGVCDGPQPSNEDLPPREGTGLLLQKTPVLRSQLLQLSGRSCSPLSSLKQGSWKALWNCEGTLRFLCWCLELCNGLPRDAQWSPSCSSSGWRDTRTGEVGGTRGREGEEGSEEERLLDSLYLRPFPLSVSFPRNQLLAQSPWQGFWYAWVWASNYLTGPSLTRLVSANSPAALYILSNF